MSEPGKNPPPILSYERRLSADSGWGLGEGSLYFEEKSLVHEALRKIVRRLHDANIPYAVMGDLAFFRHGYRRFCEVVEVLVSAEALREIHESIVGNGYHFVAERSRQIRDNELGVRILFFVAGEFPGDGQPKAIAFPNPSDACIEIDGVCCLELSRQLELKLISGMASNRRLRDLADVMDVIKKLKLPREFSSQLDASVRGKFEEFWEVCQVPDPHDQ